MSEKHDKKNSGTHEAPKEDKDAASSGQSGTSSEQRRESLRRILAGGGIVIGADSLPSKWGKPLIDSVVLPAHAATSLADPCALNVTPVSGGVQVVVSGFVSPPTGGVNVDILVELLSGASVIDSDTTSATSDGSGEYTAPPVTLSGSGTAVRATTSLDGVDQAVCQQPIGTTTTGTTSTTFTTSTSTFTSTTTSFL